MSAKYVDIPSIVQVIGCIYKDPSLLDNENYFFTEEDFTQEFHKILFGSIYNLHQLGAKKITFIEIENYLEARPNKLAVYKVNQGAEYLAKAAEIVQISSFSYYYNKMKKMTLLRMYNSIGMNLNWLYDIDNVIDVKKRQAQEDWLDNTSLSEIANIIDKKILEIRAEYVDNNLNDKATQAGDGIIDLLYDLRKLPEYGYPLYGPLINTVTKGARLKKFYLRSAATGVGKSRAMIADACNFACDEIFDLQARGWKANGTKEPTLYISTEQEKNEIQTMMLAFVSGVDEDRIISGIYTDEEWERVLHAGEVIKNSPIYVECLSDFSIKDIENSIKRAIHEWDVKYCCFDYLHTSMKILEEISSKTGIKGLREDNVLFMLSIRLKDMCNKYGIFIMTATQLNSDYVTAQQYDQNLLRGAKAIADKIDVGLIMLETSQEDLEALRAVINEGGYDEPAIKISIYKNRRGKYKNILLWCRANRGVCRIEPMFATNYQYQLVPIEDTQIEVEESAF